MVYSPQQTTNLYDSSRKYIFNLIFMQVRKNDKNVQRFQLSVIIEDSWRQVRQQVLT